MINIHVDENSLSVTGTLSGLLACLLAITSSARPCLRSR